MMAKKSLFHHLLPISDAIESQSCCGLENVFSAQDIANSDVHCGQRARLDRNFTAALRTFFLSRRLGCSFLSPLHRIHRLHHEEDTESNNQEIENIIDKQPVLNSETALVSAVFSLKNPIPERKN